MISSIRKCIRVGWITDRGLPTCFYHRFYFTLSDAGVMRYKNIAEELKKLDPEIKNEIYVPGRRYDLIVILKKITDDICELVYNNKKLDTKIIFDANVNYYEVWGEFPVPNTKPSPEQQKNAIWLTSNTDGVVADSSYIAGICSRYNHNIVFIPDNINLNLFRGGKIHDHKEKINVIWSGVAKKAYHFNVIENVLIRFRNKIKLTIVSDEFYFPEVIERLKRTIEVDIVKFEYKKYPKLLLQGDIIVSPKLINNSYEIGHSEYKITLGMAQGLPVIASPQQSYIEALENSSAGFICKDEGEWLFAFEELLNSPELRQIKGTSGRDIVVRRYSSPIIAMDYLKFINKTLNR